MLAIPSGSSSIASFLGIDPGSVHLGVGIINFDVDTHQIESSTAFTLNAEKLIRNEWMNEVHGDRFSRIFALEDNLVELFQRVKPLEIACESPFINMSRPAAYGALVQVVCTITNAVRRFDPYKPLYAIDPSSVKNAVGAKGNAGKDPVRMGLMNLSELNYQGTIPLANLGEHSCDALAVAYSRFIIRREAAWRYRNFILSQQAG